MSNYRIVKKGDTMKQHDFLSNLILVLFTGLLAAGICCLAARGGIPYVYTSNTTVQLTGDELHTGDVKEYAGFIQSDATVLLSTVANLDLVDSGMRPLAVDQLLKHISVNTEPLEGVVKITVRTDDPYKSRDIANEIVTVSGNLFEASHPAIRVNRVEAALAAEACDKRPVGLFTLIGGLIGVLVGMIAAFMAVRKMRIEKRNKRTVDSRYKKIVSEEEKEDDDLYDDDNEDVDPEMRELLRVARMAEKNRDSVKNEEDFTEIRDDQEVLEYDVDDREMPTEVEDFTELREDSPTEADDRLLMTKEAGTAYREAMEIEAMGYDADTKDNAAHSGNTAIVQPEEEISGHTDDYDEAAGNIKTGSVEDTRMKGGDEDEA